MGWMWNGAPMSDEHTAESWCDGNNSQIDTIVSEEGIQRYATNNVIANKHKLVASWMIIASHVKEDISCLDESKCLLANPGNNRFLVCSNEELSHLGCYLHYNQKEYIWFISGCSTGEGGFGNCLKTHLERASSDRNNDDSHFYHSFPSKLSERANYFSKEGYF